MPKIKAVQVSEGDGYLVIVDDKGRVWRRYNIGRCDWYEVDLPNEPKER